MTVQFFDMPPCDVDFSDRESVRRLMNRVHQPLKKTETQNVTELDDARDSFRTATISVGGKPAVPLYHATPGALPSSPAERKRIPLYSGVLRYFPDAIVAVAECSQDGNDQHNPGEPLHWAREKSQDHHDCIVRHLLDVGTRDERGIRHSARLAWRALAALQLEIEAEQRA